jgi:autotransporter-associated beta strand protein
MKKLTQFIAYAALVAGLTPQIASAVLFTNTVRNIQARNVRVNLSATGVSSGETYSSTNGAIRNQYVSGTGGATGKAWVQFDLSSTWAAYGQANLASATLTLWNQNGTGRRFWVAGIADSAGLEGWDQNTLTWSNAPANNYYNLPTMGYGFDYAKCYNNTNIWEVNGAAQTAGIDVSTPVNTQGAYYVSPDISGFLGSDTDGKVTCAISDGPFNLNQTIPIGTNGVYAGQPLAPNGIPTKDSPTLTLVFDVRVALIGGGVTCPGGGGLEVSMAGTDAGEDYLLYTNGVYAGQTVSGTGSAVSFGLKSQAAVYTALASNITTTVTSPVVGSATISAPLMPGIAVQPVSVTAATNSIALFNITGTDNGLSYQWYRNGVQLTDDGHYSGTTTTQLVINPVLASDAATTANGYYNVVANSCGDVVFSKTNALTIQAARTLVWVGTPANSWDIATTANWLNSANSSATVFDQGDNVILDDTAQSTTVAPASPYLSPGTITFNHSYQMIINGGGNISGPASELIVNGSTASSELFVNSPNDFGGGTIINDGWLYLGVNNAVGTNTITMAGTTFSLVEVKNAGGAGNGIPGVNILADSSLVFNGSGSYAGVILGSLTGTAGKTLTITAPNASVGNNVRFYGNSTCDCDIVMNINGANWAPYQSGDLIFNGVISGSGVLYPRSGNTILNGANTFAQTILSQGNVGVGIDSALGSGYSPVGLGTITHDNQGDIGLFASGAAHTIQNPFTWLYRDNANRTFKFLGTNQLTMSGAFDLSGGTNNINRIIQVDNTAPSIISGVIDDAGQSIGITKTGNGALYLNAANIYSGPTTIGAGLLAGSGSVAGSVVVTNGMIGGGTAASMGGTFTIGGDLTFANGGGFFRVNPSGSQSDMVSVAGNLSNTGNGTITVTNLGAALQVGDTFTLFNKAVTTGNTMSITGAGVTWTNKLAVDGSIAVFSLTPPIVTYPTNLSYSVSGSTLTVSWPATHQGWVLQAQTNNLVVGLGTNWITIPGTASVTSTNLPINPANPTVFYRLSTP